MPTAASPNGEAVKRAAASLAVDSRCRLGESPVWCERRATLFWVDITGQRLWSHRPADAQTRSWEAPDALGCVALCEDGRLLLGLAKELCLAEPADDIDAPLRLTPLVAVEPDYAHTRVNDGRCDRDGNFVFGTKLEREGASPHGSFYQYSAAHGLRRLAIPHAAIPNSICFSRDGGTLYFCDSSIPEILCCHYDAATAKVASIRRFARLDPDSAAPDGSCIDADGGLWNAQWGAGRVVRYDGDGMPDAIVPVPVRNPSCCAFGGTQFERLYVTTARQDMGDDELAASPTAGGVFASDVGMSGLAESRFAAP